MSEEAKGRWGPVLICSVLHTELFYGANKVSPSKCHHHIITIIIIISGGSNMITFEQSVTFQVPTSQSKTLPEAQRTQGIESITWIMFLTEINLKLFWLKKIMQVTDSIPWVRCASGNVFQLVLNFFSTFGFNFFLQFSLASVPILATRWSRLY